jgi:hypothetical protein
MNSRIAAVPFRLRNLKEDLEDLGSNFDGATDLEFRHAREALERHSKTRAGSYAKSFSNS